MFSLLRGLWDYFFSREEYYILIIGLHNAGKTVSTIKYVVVLRFTFYEPVSFDKNG